MVSKGAYIGYLSLMDLINKNNNNLYKILQEEDYTITNIDQGQTLFGSIHQKQLLEDFQIKNPQAVKTNNKLHLYSDDQRHSFFTNNSVDNKTRVLILGDSYFNGFIVDDIAESFHETIMIWGDYTKHFIQIIEEYQPDIVIHENVERVDRFHNIVKVANAITDLEKQES